MRVIKEKWYNMGPATGQNGPKKAVIEICGPIADEDYWGMGVVSAEKFIADLGEIGAETDLEVYIQSNGGVVTAGLAIYNALKHHKGEVTIHVRGLAASMASIIALAGDKLIMPAQSYLMIHRVSGGVWGNADDLRNAAESVEKLESSLVDIYAEKTGLDREELNTMLDKETWISGVEALKMGFCDELEGESAKTAAANELQMHTLKGALCAGFAVPVALLQPSAEAEETSNPDLSDPTDPTDQEDSGDDTEPEAVDPGADDDSAPVEPAAEDSTETPEETEETETIPETENSLDTLLRKVKERFGLAERNGDEKPVPAAQYEAQITALRGENETLQTANAELQAQVETLQAERKSAELAAADILATFGFGEDELDELPPVDGGGDPANIEAQIEALNKQIENETDKQRSASLLNQVRELRAQL